MQELLYCFMCVSVTGNLKNFRLNYINDVKKTRRMTICSNTHSLMCVSCAVLACELAALIGFTEPSSCRYRDVRSSCNTYEALHLYVFRPLTTFVYCFRISITSARENGTQKGTMCLSSVTLSGVGYRAHVLGNRNFEALSLLASQSIIPSYHRKMRTSVLGLIVCSLVPSESHPIP